MGHEWFIQYGEGTALEEALGAANDRVREDMGPVIDDRVSSAFTAPVTEVASGRVLSWDRAEGLLADMADTGYTQWCADRAVRAVAVAAEEATRRVSFCDETRWWLRSTRGWDGVRQLQWRSAPEPGVAAVQAAVVSGVVAWTYPGEWLDVRPHWRDSLCWRMAGDRVRVTGQVPVRTAPGVPTGWLFLTWAFQ